MIGDSRQTRLAVVLILPVALVGLGFVLDARGTFPLLRFAIERSASRAPSTLIVPPDELRRGVSTVSLYLRPQDLTDPKTGILPNRLQHGPAWERYGWVSFFEGGRVVHSSGVGVRIHGGGSRVGTGPQGFRLFFRRRYGLHELPGGIAFDGAHAHPLRRLILHSDVRRSRNGLAWHLVNPLAYDIAAAAGGITSATRPVRFLLNGRFQGVFVLKEHFHPQHYFETHAGHRVNLKAAEFDELWRQVADLRPLRMQRVARLVDLDNLTRWFIGVVFCATADAYQGPAQFRDPTRADAQWFWVSWDMDGSFRDPKVDSFPYLLSRTGRRRARRPSDPRPRILTTLLDEDADYRAYFMRVWVDVMNHALTPEFLDQRFRYYRDLGQTLGLENRADLPLIEQFLRERPAIVRTHAERWLGTPPSVPVAVVGDRGALEVDGHVVQPGWTGHYFPGMTVSIRVPEVMAYALSHWRVNGREVHSATLAIEAREALEIEPIWVRGATLPRLP
ncbi:MAG: CotH kinase family protein [Vicinamibacteria bacterium]|nr:CotH kinase family protein [Vicinamibacteria bacterium]